MFDRSLEGSANSAYPSVLRLVHECTLTRTCKCIRELRLIVDLRDRQAEGCVNQRRADHSAKSRTRRKKPVGFERLVNGKTRRCAAGVRGGTAKAVTHPQGLVIKFAPKNIIPELKIDPCFQTAGKGVRTQFLTSGRCDGHHAVGNKIIAARKHSTRIGGGSAKRAADIATYVEAIPLRLRRSSHNEDRNEHEREQRFLEHG